MSGATVDVGGGVRRGLAWSTVNNIVLRMGTFATGIVLARLLTPEQFGLYAIALTVQAILMTLADLGLSADLIRSEDPERRAPTVGALGLVSGSVLAGAMALTAVPLAGLLGSPGSAPVIAALALTLVLAGAGVVPYATLMREFRQKALFGIAVVDFAVSTVVTIGLVLAGWGVMSLAVGRILAQVVVLVLQFRLTGTRPRYRVDRELAPSVLAFGLPIAGANMLSWVLINVDNVVIARYAGPVALGFYFLAFNISNWPMSVIGQIVRSVALPAFSRAARDPEDRSLDRGLALTWALALPAGAMLAVLASPLVLFVYGGKWADSAPVLAALGLFGSLRVVFDLMVAYLIARGDSRTVLWVQVLWLVVLTPAMVLATHRWGIVGGGWAHVAVALVVILPAYLVALHRAGAVLTGLARATWPPVAAMVPTAVAAWFAAAAFSAPPLAFLAGGAAGAVVYLGLVGRWLLTLVRERSDGPTPLPPTESATTPLGETL